MKLILVLNRPVHSPLKRGWVQERVFWAVMHFPLVSSRNFGWGCGGERGGGGASCSVALLASIS